jgi:hypothetical protein
MLNRIETDSKAITHNRALQPEATTTTNDVSKTSASGAKATSRPVLENSPDLQAALWGEVSQEAKTKALQNQEVAKYTRAALRSTEGYQPERVKELKALYEGGQIEDYFQSINLEEVANAVLQGPYAKLFQ